MKTENNYPTPITDAASDMGFFELRDKSRELERKLAERNQAENIYRRYVQHGGITYCLHGSSSISAYEDLERQLAEAKEKLKSSGSDIKMIAMGCKPDPYNFEIVELEHCGSNTIILANYDGCLSFGGNKLMVLRGLHNLMDFETLDPHFLDEDYAVIARFIPTQLGWDMARKICE